VLNTLYEKHPKIVARRIADEVILVPISREVGEIDSLYVLNDVGARIWDLIDGRSLEQVRDAIVDEFEVNEATAEEDLTLLIEQLKEIGAIHEVS
jgi:coenzyme PQQ synthesis protein D (PqqD)